MGQYRIRKARPGETPGYYTKEQLAMKKFVAGGYQEENDIDLSSLIPRLSQSFVKAIMNDPDPESVDIRSMMSQSADELQNMGVDSDAIVGVVNAAGKQALQFVANVLNKDVDSDEDETVAVGNDVVESTKKPGDEETSINDYGYYDDSNASDDGEDDQLINDMLMSSNATQNTEVAQMGMQVNNPESYEAFEKLMQYGGANGKRKFIKETMNNLSKAAAGMEQQKQNTASLRGTENDMQGTNLTSKDTFVPAVKQIAQNKVDREFAEQQYNSMMNQEFQFGGSNRRIRRANRAMFGTPFAPPGVNTDYDFGLFGGLRSANVSWDPRMMQGMFGMASIMPGMMSGYSGGWYSPKYQIKGTRVKSSSETPSAINAKIENKEALDKVSKDTPNSDATSSERTLEQMRSDALKYAGYDASGGNSGWSPGTANTELNSGTSGDGTSSNGSRSSNNNSNSNNNNASVNPIIRDAWGRPQGDPWFNYDPNSKKKNVKPLSDEEAYKRMKQGDKKSGFDKNIKQWDYSGKNRKSQAIYADDELIQDIVLGVPGIKDALGFASRMAGNVTSRTFGNNKGLPNSQRQLGNNQRQLPGGPKSLGSGSSGSNSGSSNNLPGEPDWDRMRSIMVRNTKNKEAIDDLIHNLTIPSLIETPFAQHDFGHINKTNSGLAAQGLWLHQQKLKNKKKKQVGGAISPELYKYIYGGDDIDQDDIDFTYSKDVTDPYFQDGGLYHFDGENDSQVKSGQNTGLTREDVQKMFDEYAKKQNPQQGQQQYYNQQQVYPGSFGSSGVGQPMWGRPQYGGGYSGRMGQYGNLFGVMTKDFDYYSPYGQGKSGKMAVDPNMAFAASMANIQKSGMIPTGFKYSKERKQDGNWFERNLGFNKDRVMTIDYAKPGSLGQGQTNSYDADNNGVPDNIQSNQLVSNTITTNNQVEGAPNKQPEKSSIYSNTEGLKGSTSRKIRRAERRLARQMGDEQDMEEDVMDETTLNNPSVSNTPNFPLNNAGPMNDPQEPDFQQNQSALDYMKNSLTVPNSSQPAPNTSMQPRIKSTTGMSSIYESEPSSGNVYKDPNARPTYNSLYGSGQKSNTGIDATYEPEPITPNIAPVVKAPVSTPFNSSMLSNQSMMSVTDNEGFAYGGYVPEFSFEDGGYIPEYVIAGEVNNQVNPLIDQMNNTLDPKFYAPAPEKNKMTDCSEEDKKNPASPCYESDTEQIRLTKETAKTFDPRALANVIKSGASTAANIKNELDAVNNSFVPGMQNAIYNRGNANQRIETGPWEENKGAFNKMGFEGIVKKGGTTGFRKNGEYQLTMDEIRAILKAGGKVEFL